MALCLNCGQMHDGASRRGAFSECPYPSARCTICSSLAQCDYHKLHNYWLAMRNSGSGQSGTFGNNGMSSGYSPAHMFNPVNPLAGNPFAVNPLVRNPLVRNPLAGNPPVGNPPATTLNYGYGMNSQTPAFGNYNSSYGMISQAPAFNHGLGTNPLAASFNFGHNPLPAQSNVFHPAVNQQTSFQNNGHDQSVRSRDNLNRRGTNRGIGEASNRLSSLFGGSRASSTRPPSDAFTEPAPAVPVFRCQVCRQKFGSERSLMQHKKDKHSVEKFKRNPDTPVPAATTGLKFECAICHRKFNRGHGLGQHMEAIHRTKKMRTKHGAATVDMGLNFGCNHCGDKFGSANDLATHLNDQVCRVFWGLMDTNLRSAVAQPRSQQRTGAQQGTDDNNDEPIIKKEPK